MERKRRKDQQRHGIDKLVARFPGEIQTWPMTYDPPMLTMDQIIHAEDEIYTDLDLIELEVASPFKADSAVKHVKYGLCGGPTPEDEQAIRLYERKNADFYNGNNDDEVLKYADDKGFVIQISEAVPDAEAAARLEQDKRRWKQYRPSKTVDTDPALYGTIYVETDPDLHPSMRTGDARERWGYIDLICSPTDERRHSLGIGARLMQLAVLGCMRRGVQHLVLDSVKSQIHKYRDWGFVPWTSVAKTRQTLMYAQWIMHVWERLVKLNRYYSKPHRGPRSGEITENDAFSESEEDWGYNSDEHVASILNRYHDQLSGRLTSSDDGEFKAFNRSLDENKQPRITFYSWDEARQLYLEAKRILEEREAEVPTFLQCILVDRRCHQNGVAVRTELER
jgi:hypothetical protein